VFAFTMWHSPAMVSAERSDPIRRRALRWMAVGVLVGAAWVAAVVLLSTRGVNLYGPGLGVPLVPFLIGVTELILGRSFGELARGWDELAGWQRGILGLAIVSIAGTIIVGGVGLVLAIVLRP
jgi:hypothetical protein